MSTVATHERCRVGSSVHGVCVEHLLAAVWIMPQHPRTQMAYIRPRLVRRLCRRPIQVTSAKRPTHSVSLMPSQFLLARNPFVELFLEPAAGNVLAPGTHLRSR